MRFFLVLTSGPAADFERSALSPPPVTKPPETMAPATKSRTKRFAHFEEKAVKGMQILPCSW